MRTYRFMLLLMSLASTAAFGRIPTGGRRLVSARAAGPTPSWPPTKVRGDADSVEGSRHHCWFPGRPSGCWARRPPPSQLPCFRGKTVSPRKSVQRCRGPTLCADGSTDIPGGDAVLVLGAGWVGSRLALSLQREYRVIVTHRAGFDAASKPPYFRPVPLDLPPDDEVTFDIDDHTTWDNLPPPEALSSVVITFPLTSAPAAFWDAYLCRVENVICYSTTSVYQVGTPGQLVDETTPTRDTPRAVAESYCLERGATVLTISGIFGERRSPRGICTCLTSYTSSGGVLNGNKRVNMVHVDDIVLATKACVETPRPAQRINVAGHNFLLSQLIAHCKHPQIRDGADDDYSSKCVCSQRLVTQLMPPGFDFVAPLR